MIPTIAEAGNAAIPKELNLNGYSFLEHLKGAKEFKRKWIYCWYSRFGEREKASQHVRNQKYKLYSTGKFYDIAADPNERNSLDVAAFPEKLRKVYKEAKAILDLQVELTKTCDPIQNKKRGSKKEKKKKTKSKSIKK